MMFQRARASCGERDGSRRRTRTGVSLSDRHRAERTDATMSTHIKSVFDRSPLQARSRALVKIVLYRGLVVVITVLVALLVTRSVGDVGEGVDVRDWVGILIKCARSEMKSNSVSSHDSTKSAYLKRLTLSAVVRQVTKSVTCAHCVLYLLTAIFDPPSKISTKTQDRI